MHTVEAVARENGAVLSSLLRNGVAVFPADDAEHTPIWRELSAGRRVIDFALGDVPAAVTGSAQWVDAAAQPHWAIALRTPAGEASVRLAMAGEHNVRNALASAAAALGAGAPLSAVVAGLEAFVPVKGRSALLTVERPQGRLTLVDDSYNANPDSVRAAIDMLAGLPGPRWLVLGDMGEVGTQGPAFHEEVGRHAVARGIDHVWTAGSLCRHTATAVGAQAQSFESAADIVAALQSHSPAAPAVASVLVKGSRFMKMETVVAALLAQAGGAHAA
jgi:UDP-N-acetylmuramyl pentapeptide synthase